MFFGMVCIRLLKLSGYNEKLLDMATQKHTIYLSIKGIVSRDFVVCFVVSFDRSYIYTHQERVL
jgi:hypothetical protein